MKKYTTQDQEIEQIVIINEQGEEFPLEEFIEVNTDVDSGIDCISEKEVTALRSLNIGESFQINLSTLTRVK